MKTIILCGGKGIRLGNTSDYIPKAMVKIGYQPLIWHVMKRYALAGFSEFILALGLKGEMIKQYFVNYEIYINDIRVNLGTKNITPLTQHQETDWNVLMVDTGNTALSGARIDRCKKYLEDEEFFMVSYSDTLADVNIKDLITFHKKSKKIATVTGIIPPYREGEFLVKHNTVKDFYRASSQKSSVSTRYINGGFMVFDRRIFSYLNSFNECKLETEVFSHLIEDKQLAIFSHHGFWRWLDTQRDYDYIQELADTNNVYWLHE